MGKHKLPVPYLECTYLISYYYNLIQVTLFFFNVSTIDGELKMNTIKLSGVVMWYF